MPKYSAQDIQAITTVESIRRKPLLYVVDTTSHGLHGLALDLAGSAVDPNRANNGTALAFVIHADESISISDDGRGQPIGHFLEGDPRPIIEMVLTTRFVGGSDKPYSRLGNLLNLGSTINALSESLDLETIVESQKFRIEFAHGEIIQPLTSLGAAIDHGTRVHFKPDSSIWSEPYFDFDTLAIGLKQLVTQYPQVTISLLDERLGRIFAINKTASS